MTATPRRKIKTARHPASFDSIQAFLESQQTVSGTAQISIEGLPLHFYYDGKDEPVTVVTFSGVSSPKVRHAPAWNGFEIRGLGINRVLISGPTIIPSETLCVAWNCGSIHHPSLQDLLTELIIHIGGGTQIILFGAPGGGFTSLIQNSTLANSLITVSNPQTDMNKHEPTTLEDYLKTTWNHETTSNIGTLPFEANPAKAHTRYPSSRAAYLQHQGDTTHVQKRRTPIKALCHPANNICYLEPNLVPRHLGPSSDSFVRLLKAGRAHKAWQTPAGAIRSRTLEPRTQTIEPRRS